jgi:hypothetical protein
MSPRAAVLLIVLAHSVPGRAQSTPAAYPPPDLTTAAKWRFFTQETFDVKTPVAGLFNASWSQATNSVPSYGAGAGAFAKRFGACTTDVVTQNFFVDFAMASVFREQTRYVRRGTSYGGVWRRARYAIGRAFITRTDSGHLTPNLANFTGTALSMGVSTLYYPSSSRTSPDLEIRYAVSLVSGGLINLYPEFWPDFKESLKKHHLFPKKW